nr:MAG: ORF1 [Torque teno midi virus]
MPFWWNRRKKWWWRGRRRKWYRPRYKKKTRRRRRRQRYRKAPRRFRKRRKKVRRKFKRITLKQWNPDCIRKCKIKGFTVNCLGTHGKQFACYTDNRFDWVPATAPGGGGFGCETYSLDYLYKEFKRGNNKWSSSNIQLELCRYTGAAFTFYRHSTLDFIASYKLEYPLTLQKYTYAQSHPYYLLKSKHKKIIPSWQTKPYGKRTVRMKIKPMKLMSTKWFFQEELSTKPLLLLNTAVLDLRHSYLGCCNTNELVSFFALNLDMYQHCNWGLKSSETDHYYPHNGWKTTKTSIAFEGKDITGKTVSGNIDQTTYQKSVAIDSGWFQPKLLSIAYEFKLQQTSQQNLPLTVGRYNPTIDTGEGNKAWVVSITKDSYSPPVTDTSLVLENLPLWQMFFGFFDYIQKHKEDPSFLANYQLVFKSKFVQPNKLNSYWVVLDKNFINGKGPYGEYVTRYSRDHWYPTVEHQQETVNAIVQCGPYIPKLENQKSSTWELKSNYSFYFKWGGTQPPDQDAADPTKQTMYDPPSYLTEGIQIHDPKKQIPTTILHSWDYRRGVLTATALKRMREDQETLTSFQTDAETTPHKKKKYSENCLTLQQKEDQELQACLLSLLKENTFQEQEETTLRDLIQQQQQQQQDLKHNLLYILSNLKKQQQQLQLQTGFLS